VKTVVAALFILAATPALAQSTARPGSDTNPSAATARRHHHRAKAQTVPRR
jgi:hypothetical protein